MSTARKMSAPRTEPAIAPVDELGVAGMVDEELGEDGVEVEDGSIVEDGDSLFMQDESLDGFTVISALPP
jgi:hypothetical protein